MLVIGPRDLRRAISEFSRDSSGDLAWFNVRFSVFNGQSVLQALLLPAIFPSAALRAAGRRASFLALPSSRKGDCSVPLATCFARLPAQPDILGVGALLPSRKPGSPLPFMLFHTPTRPFVDSADLAATSDCRSP